MAVRLDVLPCESANRTDRCLIPGDGAPQHVREDVDDRFIEFECACASGLLCINFIAWHVCFLIVGVGRGAACHCVCWMGACMRINSMIAIQSTTFPDFTPFSR